MEAEIIRRWTPVAEAITRLLSPHAEIVLHDLHADRVLAIWNPFSGRSAGDESAFGELDGLLGSDQDVYGPYPKTLADGRSLSSVSAVLRDDAGVPEAALCINVDRSAFLEASRLLAAFAAPTETQPHQLFEHDWGERVNEFVASHVRRTGTPIQRFTTEDRRELIAEMDRAGVFGRQRSIPAVAHALQISRSTVYNLLAAVRKGAR